VISGNIMNTKSNKTESQYIPVSDPIRLTPSYSVSPVGTLIDNKNEADPRLRTLTRTTSSGPVNGRTYKLKWPHNKRSIYMSINYIEQPLNNTTIRIPFELFFSGGDAEINDMLKVIGRLVSSVFQRGGDIKYIIKDFVKEISPMSAFVQPIGFEKPFRVESLAAYIGYNLLDFLYFCDFPNLIDLCDELHIYGHKGIRPEKVIEVKQTGRQCPKCKEFTVHNKSGCDICDTCGDSKCS
jgi:hypothetical protein